MDFPLALEGKPTALHVTGKHPLLRFSTTTERDTLIDYYKLTKPSQKLSKEMGKKKKEMGKSYLFPNKVARSRGFMSRIYHI